MFTRMESDSVVTTGGVDDGDVMAAVEEGPVEEFVIADVSRDEAYLTVPLADAASLPAWR
jgi:hypothetical protein